MTRTFAVTALLCAVAFAASAVAEGRPYRGHVIGPGPAMPPVTEGRSQGHTLGPDMEALQAAETCTGRSGDCPELRTAAD